MPIFGDLFSLARLRHAGGVACLGRMDGNWGGTEHVSVFVSIPVFIVVVTIVVVLHRRINLVEPKVLFMRFVGTVKIETGMTARIISRGKGAVASLVALRHVVVTATCIDGERTIAGFLNLVLVLGDVAGCQCCIVEGSHPVGIDGRM